MKSPIKILHFITNSCDHPYLYTVTDYTNKDEFEISVGSSNEAGDLQKHYEKLIRLLRKNKIDII